MTIKRFAFAVVSVMAVLCASASDSVVWKKYVPEVHATLRTRFELNTADGTGRFQVRNARLNMKGKVADFLGYYLRADFSDRGSFKLTDAYITLTPIENLNVMMGHMRVPLSVDGSRSVNNYWFSNRSLLSRDMWVSRKVGLKARYTFDISGNKSFVEGGVFSSASTTAQTVWSKRYTFGIIGGVTFGDWAPEIGYQSHEIGITRANLYDASLTWTHGLWQAEAEALYKAYSNRSAESVKAFNVMGRRFFRINTRMADLFSIDLRYDSSTDNCDGKRDDNGNLIVTQPSRRRITAGTTLAYLRGPVKAHIRLNYDWNFQLADRTYSANEANRLTLELMLHF
ncbi:MAG: OprO/OprP family phosphate-selective porin [Muribaculaceae bacterium]|nr:OprO/OprP family phosphate-selective porin [Muribaculaceae bacterium]